MQIKSAVRYHLKIIKIAIIKKSTNNMLWRRCREKGKGKPPTLLVEM